MKDRYILVSDSLILDRFEYDESGREKGYLLPSMFQNDTGKYHNANALVDKLNDYDKQLNGNLYNDTNLLLQYENTILPSISSFINEQLSNLPLYSSEEFNVQVADVGNIRDGEFRKHTIECKVSYTDSTGFVEPSDKEFMKQIDKYTLTRILLEVNNYIDEFADSDRDKILLFGLRARLLTEL